MTKKHSNNSENNFDKKALSITHLLHPYVKQRIKVGENLGVFPKNMYQSNEVIDEVVLSIYENRMHEEMDTDQLRLMMFDLTNTKLMSLFENEKWHKKAISTKFMLEEELRLLEENFTVDGGRDLILNEDLDDISYHQDDQFPILPYEYEQGQVISFLDVDDGSRLEDVKNGNVLTKAYLKLPVQTTNVVDLYVLGKLDIQEIASILQLEPIEVKRIIDFVKEIFRKYLD